MKLYDLTMENAQRIGNKTYANVPTELLFADPAFQRIDSCSERKISRLVERWDTHMMDTLRICPHPETENFSVIDGYHRLCAAKQKGIQSLPCEIITNMPTDTKERLVREAFLFANQNVNMETLTPLQKHKGNLICGKKENLALQKLIEKYDISMKSDRAHNVRKGGVLTGFAEALDKAKADADILDMVFRMICESRWNLAENGYCKAVIRALWNVLHLHDGNEEAMVTLWAYMRNREPNNFLAEAKAKYPMRSQGEANTLYLEDWLVDHSYLPRVYTGGTVK